jgi:hypothetical protein
VPTLPGYFFVKILTGFKLKFCSGGVYEKTAHKVWDLHRIQILLRGGIGKDLS